MITLTKEGRELNLEEGETVRRRILEQSGWRLRTPPEDEKVEKVERVEKTDKDEKVEKPK